MWPYGEICGNVGICFGLKSSGEFKLITKRSEKRKRNKIFLGCCCPFVWLSESLVLCPQCAALIPSCACAGGSLGISSLGSGSAISSVLLSLLALCDSLPERAEGRRPGSLALLHCSYCLCVKLHQSWASTGCGLRGHPWDLCYSWNRTEQTDCPELLG